MSFQTKEQVKEDKSIDKKRADYLLGTDRYDIVKKHSALVSCIRRMQKLSPENEEFCIFLEGWPQCCPELRSYYKQRLRFEEHKRQIWSLRFTFAQSLVKMIFIPEIRVYAAIDQSDDLLLLTLNEEKQLLEQLMTVENMCGASQLMFIKESRQLVVGGTGFLKLYSFLQGTERSAKLDTGVPIKCSLRYLEFVRFIEIDPALHRIFLLTDTRALVLNYATMEEVKNFADEESGRISCCAMFRHFSHEYFITGAKSGLIKLWNPTCFTEHHCYKGHKTNVNQVIVLQSKARLFSSSDDGWVFIWALDVLQPPLQKVKVGDTVVSLGLTNERGKSGFWCDVKSTIVFYEFDMFYTDFALMDSAVYKLINCRGYEYHPNRIMVATEDGGVRHLNPVTAALIAYMFPMTTLRLVQHFAYNVFRKRTYMLLQGSVIVLNCAQSPFRKLEIYKPSSYEDGVTCICSSLVSIGNVEDIIVFAGLRNGQIQILCADSFGMTKAVQAHHSEVVMISEAKEMDPKGEYVYYSTRVLVSIGADHVVKAWGLECWFDAHVGLDLRFRVLYQIRCEMSPLFVNSTFKRICIAYGTQPKVHMYKVNFDQALTATTTKVAKLLRHTPDYDHTDKITDLACCALLKIFATSSVDRTIKRRVIVANKFHISNNEAADDEENCRRGHKRGTLCCMTVIWDYSNELLRELIFLVPVNTICFATEIGHLLAATEQNIRCCEPEKYLPWSYLEEIKSKNFQTEVQLQLQKCPEPVVWLGARKS